ncbi:MAG: DegV family protein [Clostridia bacterium]|nr:DegV family protein [Clostridia bacterium]
MIQIFVDSGSSIKQEEREKYGVEILPLRFLMGETEYRDGIDLTMDDFYRMLIGKKLFPKTSLPFQTETVQRVEAYTKKGYDVVILSISSKISGTYSAFCSWFADNPKVTVVDTLTAVGGVRLLVEEMNKHLEEPLKDVLARVYALIPRIRVYAIPETLNYLFRGGRLSRKEWLIGGLLDIKPVVSLNEEGVKVVAKKRGLKKTMHLISDLVAEQADPNYSIIPSYTYDDANLKLLISMTDEKFYPLMEEYDHLDPVIACHWGPNAFGYIFIGK